jgi:acyl-CoA hydrolase
MELISQKLCMASDLGICKRMFGGAMMSLVDESVALFVRQKIHSINIVTLLFDKMQFLSPVFENEAIRVYAEVKEYGNTSINVEVEVRKYDVFNATEQIVLHTNAIFVNLSSDGKPCCLNTKLISDYENKKRKK